MEILGMVGDLVIFAGLFFIGSLIVYSVTMNIE